MVLKDLTFARKRGRIARNCCAQTVVYRGGGGGAWELDSYPCLTLSYLPEIYPAGDEIVLIQETTGRTVGPGHLPRSVGVCVFNVETAYNTARAAENISVTHKYVTIAGEVKNAVYRCVCRSACRFGDAVALAGGAAREDAVYISGGPMTGCIASPYDVVTKTTNAILLMPPEHTIVNKRRIRSSVSVKRAMSACCQCRMCTDLCPRHLLGHPIEPHALWRAVKDGHAADIAAVRNTAFCCGCGVCEMYACPQGLNPRSLIAACKDELRKTASDPPQAEGTGVLETARLCASADVAPACAARFSALRCARAARRAGNCAKAGEAPVASAYWCSDSGGCRCGRTGRTRTMRRGGRERPAARIFIRRFAARSRRRRIHIL